MCFFKEEIMSFPNKVVLAYFVVQSSQRLMNFVRVVQMSRPSVLKLIIFLYLCEIVSQNH